MENQNINNNNIIKPPFLNKDNSSFLEKKFKEVNEELISIYEISRKEEHENTDKSMQRANKIVDILKLFLDDLENLKENVMEVINPDNKSEFLQEEKNNDMEIDFQKLAYVNIFFKDKNFYSIQNQIKNNQTCENLNFNKNFHPQNISSGRFNIKQEKKVILDKSDIKHLLGGINIDKEAINEENKYIDKIISNYKEEIKKVINQNPNIIQTTTPIRNTQYTTNYTSINNTSSLNNNINP